MSARTCIHTRSSERVRSNGPAVGDRNRDQDRDRHRGRHSISSKASGQVVALDTSLLAVAELLSGFFGTITLVALRGACVGVQDLLSEGMGRSDTCGLAVDIASLAASYAALRWGDTGFNDDWGAGDGSVLRNGENTGDEGKDDGGVLHVD
jgi:hypothetical protein